MVCNMVEIGPSGVQYSGSNRVRNCKIGRVSKLEANLEDVGVSILGTCSFLNLCSETSKKNFISFLVIFIKLIPLTYLYT